MMKSEAKQLARAILTRAKELGVTVGKTKLIKLLYLADIEHYRETNETLTGMAWIFYLYGPWSRDFDGLLDQLEAEGSLSKKTFTSSGIEGEQLSIEDEIDLGKVLKPVGEYFRTKHLIDTWLERATSQLLDYVYFETEPMRFAMKGRPLDFSVVSKEPPLLYRRSPGTGTPQQKSLLRKRLAEMSKGFKQQTAEARQRLDLTYSEEFAEALALLSAEGAE